MKDDAIYEVSAKIVEREDKNVQQRMIIQQMTEKTKNGR